MQVIWIESVEVDTCLDQNNIFLSMVNSNLAFCAKRWVSTFLQRLKRSVSSFTNLKIPVDHQGIALFSPSRFKFLEGGNNIQFTHFWYICLLQYML